MTDKPFVVGIMGHRGVGKSNIAKFLVHDYGFASIHPFGGGKDMLSTYFIRNGLSPNAANNLLNDPVMKLVPFNEIPELAHLPYENAVDMMENWGKFMSGQGLELTMGTEIRRAEKASYNRIVVESVAYEYAYLTENYDAFLIYVKRPNNDREPGKFTDALELESKANAIVLNDRSLTDLFNKIGPLVVGAMFDRGMDVEAIDPTFQGE